jgi:type I restriction enzyme S subunit
MKTATKTKFKQTEIGKSPELGTAGEWRQARLAEICVHSAFGPRFSGELYAPDGNVATLRTTDISEDGRIEYATMPLARLDLSKFQQHLLHEDDLVVTRTGRVGTTAVFDGFRLPVLAGAFLIRFRLNRELAEPHFYRYYFNSPEGRALITSVATGSVQQNLNITSLHGLVIPVPPLREQRAIAHILCTLDDKIELNHQMNKTLEAIGQAIFKHWFIDFEFSNEEGKPYKSSGGEMTYNKELEKEIPKSWLVKPIDKVADFLNGLAMQKYPAVNEIEFLPVIKIRELRQGITDASGKASLDIPKKYVVRDGDVLFSWSGSLEVVIWTSGEGALNQHLFKVTSKDYPKWFYYYWLLQHLAGYRHIAEGKATTMGHIQRHHLKSSLVVVPDRTGLQTMDKILSSLVERIIELNMESRNLSRIRDSLLPKLMSGKVRVPVEAR